mmetsp:Transcript_70149/g.195160  ORF Transcript_70149/g.195160 Transcript_70149/m.195160 type:complete len:509 (-) Transcript_70149:173-1699(-)
MAGEIVLAASLDDQGILATDLHSGAVVATFEESSAQPGAFGMIGSSSGHIFAVQAKKALWSVWAWGDKKPCYRASLPEKTTAMAFSADGSFCFAGMASGSIYVWQLGTGCLLRCWPAHFREITQLLISQDESFLVSASADSTVKIYSLADIFAEQKPRPFHSLSGHALAVTSLAQLVGRGLSQTIVSAGLDRSVRLWDVGTGQPVTTHTLPSSVHCVSANPSSSEILCACSDGELRSIGVADSHTGPVGLYSGHTGAVGGCAFNADGSRAASCSEVDRVRVWETRMRQCISQVHAARNIQIGAVRIVHRIACSPGLPAFQPFQRLLTAPEDAPPVPLCLGGRGVALEERLEALARPRDFVDRVLWSEESGLQSLVRAAEADEKLAAEQAERLRWSTMAAALYDELEHVRASQGGSVLHRAADHADVAAPSPAASGSHDTEAAGTSAAPSATDATGATLGAHKLAVASPSSVACKPTRRGRARGMVDAAAQPPAAAPAAPRKKRRRSAA